MNYKIIFFLFFLFSSCTQKDLSQNYKKKIIFSEAFSNQGFALIFNENLKKQKIISKKMDDRSLIIFQRNLAENTVVKITNLENDKSIIAKVGSKAIYPLFYNSVISKRISNVLDLNVKEPYIKIKQIDKNSSFIAKKAKMFEEEKKVADKAPVDDITIDDINKNEEVKMVKKKNDFNYIIKVADFYFIKSAKNLKKRIINELKINDARLIKLSKKSFRVYLGPYHNLESLKNAFNDISKLQFENIEILKL